LKAVTLARLRTQRGKSSGTRRRRLLGWGPFALAAAPQLTSAREPVDPPDRISCARSMPRELGQELVEVRDAALLHHDVR